MSAAYNHYLKQVKDGGGLGKTVLGHTDLYFAWRFRAIARSPLQAKRTLAEKQAAADRSAARVRELEEAKLPGKLMIDFSHANSSKQIERQTEVARDVGTQIAGGSDSIFGVMIESHLKPGAQKFSPGKDDASKLVYGQSITDPCLGWEASVEVLGILAQAVKKRRGN